MSESNRAKLERFFAAFETGDMTTMTSLLHEEVEFHEAPSLPYGGVYRGQNGWTAMAGAVLSAFDDLVIEPRYIVGAADDERLGAMHGFSGRSKITGEGFETEVFEMWRFEDGLVREVRVHYFDTALLARLAGSAPAGA